MTTVSIRFWVDASLPQHTPGGYLLYNMYYGTFLDRVLKREERTGYPHNGGEHTLNLHLSWDDLQAFLDVVHETYKARAFAEGKIELIHKINVSLAEYERNRGTKLGQVGQSILEQLYSQLALQ